MVKKLSDSTCKAHWWIIETPAGETSKGKCKLCGAERDYITGHTSKGYNKYPTKNKRGPAVVMENTLPYR